MSKSRNVIAIALLIAVLSLLSSTISALITDGSREDRRTMYGIRARGYQACFELLEELSVPVERRTGPLSDDISHDATVVLLTPDPYFVAVEPAYLASLGRWVRDGGRIVVAAELDMSSSEYLWAQGGGVGGPVGRGNESKNVFELLGVEGITIDQYPLNADQEDSIPAVEERGSRFRDVVDEVQDMAMSTIELVTERTPVECTGKFASLPVESVNLPAFAWMIDGGVDEADGVIVSASDNETDDQLTLAASFTVGQGEVIVVADPSIFQNGAIALSDNAVLATELLAKPVARGQTPYVVFDGFYHGMVLRGNPMWLMGQQGYGVATLCIVFLVGLAAWRGFRFLGPPRVGTKTSRRSIGEYVDAMSRFLVKGRGSHVFLLREIKRGVLFELHQRLGRSAGRLDADSIIATIRRRDPDKADQIESAVSRVEHVLNQGRPSSRDVVNAMQRMSACL